MTDEFLFPRVVIFLLLFYFIFIFSVFSVFSLFPISHEKLRPIQLEHSVGVLMRGHHYRLLVYVLQTVDPWRRRLFGGTPNPGPMIGHHGPRFVFQICVHTYVFIMHRDHDEQQVLYDLTTMTTTTVYRVAHKNQFIIRLLSAVARRNYVFE